MSETEKGVVGGDAVDAEREDYWLFVASVLRGHIDAWLKLREKNPRIHTPGSLAYQLAQALRGQNVKIQGDV